MNTRAHAATPLQLPAILLAGMSGAAAFNLAPLLLPAANAALSLSDSQVGFLMTAEIGGLALASLLSLLLAPRLGCALLCRIGLAGILLGNILSQYASSFEALLLLRLLTGLFGDGLAYSCALVLLGQRGNATAAFALLSLVNMIYAACALALLPRAGINWDWNAITYLIAGTAATGLLLSNRLPGGETSKPAEFRNRYLARPASLLPTVGLFAYTANLGAVWTYAEPMGKASGLQSSELGIYLSLSLACQAAGSFTALALSSRFKRESLLLCVLAMQCIALSVFSFAEGAMGYLFSILLWGFSWNLGLANFLGAIAHSSAARPLLPLAPGVEALGVSMGPALVAILLGQYAVITMVVIAVALASAMIGIAAIVLATRDEKCRGAS